MKSTFVDLIKDAKLNKVITKSDATGSKQKDKSQTLGTAL